MKKSKKKYYLVYWVEEQTPCFILEHTSKNKAKCIYDFSSDFRNIINRVYNLNWFESIDIRELSIHEFIAFKLGGKIA